MSRFVTTLRTQPAALRLASEQAQTVWTLRVQSAEAWDAIKVDVVPESRVRDVKQAAMSQLMPDIDDLDAFVVKLHGFDIINEDASLHATGAVDGSTLLIISRRRRPVR